MNNHSSSSSFEILNGSSMSSGHSSPSAVVTSHLDVDSAIWLYMRKCPKYSGPLERVTIDCHVTVDLDASGQAEVPDRLILTGDHKDDVDKAVEEVERMVEHCQQSVCMKKLPTQTEAVYQKLVQHVNDVVTEAQISLGGPANIRVIGMDNEVEDAMTRLKELCGVAEDESQAVEPQGAAASSKGSRNIQIMKLEADLWKYMQKNPEFSEDVRRLKEEMHVDVVEAVSDGQRDETQVELVFSGPDDDVTAAMDKSVLLVSRCRTTTTVKSVPCPDNRVFTKVVKFLPSVNKTTSAYVSATEGVVYMTGNDEEQAVCRDKLSRLGLVIEDQPPAPSTGVVTTLDVTPPPLSAAVPAVGDEVAPTKPDVPTASEPASLMEIPRPFDRAPGRPPPHGFAPQFPADDATTTSQPRAGDPASAAGDVWPGGLGDVSAGLRGETSAELPVPIEMPLWAFVEKRRRQQLQELHEIYGVSVQSYQTDDGMVRLRLEAVDASVLDCAQDALLQLLDQLSKTISINAMETNTGQEFPRELVQLFQQLAEDTDAIIEFAGSRIIIIGTNDGTAECQQRIAAFAQQAQQMQENPEMMAEMQQRIMATAGRAGVDGETLTRNMHNQLMTGAGPMGMMGAMPGMARGSGNLMARFGGGRGGVPASMMGGFGNMMGFPAGMPRGGPAGPLSVPGTGPRGMDGGMRPPMCAPMDAGSRTMMSGGVCSMRRPTDVMHPPMGPSTTSSASTAISAPPPTTSATELLSGRPGGMVGNLATTPGSVLLGQPQPKTSDDQPAPAEMPPMMPESGPPPLTSKKAEPLPPPRMLDDAERALLQGRAAAPQMRNTDRDTAVTSSERPSNPEPTRTESRSRGRDDDDDVHPATVEATADGEACTACQAGGLEFQAAKKCPHAFCVSCVQSYFSHGETECPVCGIKDEVANRTLTQPASGHMLTTYENSFKLPGFETTSRGTIVVTYSFPAGIQTDDMPNPGRKYASTTKSAFFPMSTEGMRVVDMLQQAFYARLLFTIKPSGDTSPDELIWNGICHKTNVFGGPQQSGYPDPVYMRRVRSELASKGLK